MKYYNLLAQQQIIAKEIKLEKRRMHAIFMQTHKSWVIFMDVFFIIGILFLLGSSIITNALVVKANPDVGLYETNPVTSAVNKYEQHPQISNFSQYVKPHLFSMVGIMFFILIYFMVRYNVRDETGLILLAMISFSIFASFYQNFMNDFGYAIGKWRFG